MWSKSTLLTLHLLETSKVFGPSSILCCLKYLSKASSALYCLHSHAQPAQLSRKTKSILWNYQNLDKPRAPPHLTIGLPIPILYPIKSNTTVNLTNWRQFSMRLSHYWSWISPWQPRCDMVDLQTTLTMLWRNREIVNLLEAV